MKTAQAPNDIAQKPQLVSKWHRFYEEWSGVYCFSIADIDGRIGSFAGGPDFTSKCYEAVAHFIGQERSKENLDAVLTTLQLVDPTFGWPFGWPKSLVR